MAQKKNAFLRFIQIIYVVYAFSLFFLLMLFVGFFVFLFALFPEPKSGNLIYKVVNVWAHCWFALIGIRFKSTDLGNNSKERSYVFVSNHQSYMDIPVTVRAISQPFRILGKMEMSKIPLFGFIYRKAAILVDRSSALKRSESYINLKLAVKSGLSVLIYPEGTFNETDEPLKEFYIGAFKLAIEMQTPILPVIILDTLDRLHYSSIFSLTPGVVRVIYLPAIDVKGYDKDQAEELKMKVYQTMAQVIKQYK